MSQIISATFEDGVLKPEESLSMASGTKVRLVVDTWDDLAAEGRAACAELDELCEKLPIVAGTPRLSREELNARR